MITKQKSAEIKKILTTMSKLKNCF